MRVEDHDTHPAAAAREKLGRLDTYARLGVAVLFASASIWFGSHHNDLAMGVFLFACGAMFRIDLSGLLSKFLKA